MYLDAQTDKMLLFFTIQAPQSLASGKITGSRPTMCFIH